MLFGRTLHSTLTGINYISLNWNLVLDGLFEGGLLQPQLRVSNVDVDDMDMVNNGVSQPLSNHAKAVT
ncbi:hypothetical protein AAC387_Pa09g1787 [Persea americana]